MDPRIEALAERITRERLAELNRMYPDGAKVGLWVGDATATIKPGAKYTRVDVGRSGKYMVDQAGTIFGCKGYGAIHRGHQYGTLDTIDDWYWGGYTAVRKGQLRAVRLTRAAS